ncbi:MAG TPA: hypothetical protein VM008_20675 [Phycisphaerae bacterium]|nr:hypothetical protein [Phycisphaerae bacterium]
MARSVYFLRQDLSLAAQKSPEKQRFAEKFKRAGIVLVDSTISEQSWKRVIEHSVLLETDIPAISGKPFVERAALRAMHRKAVTQNKTPVYLKDTIEIQSDLLNPSPGIVVDIDMVPYTIPRHIIPVPFEASYLPTITPRLPPPGKSRDEPWKGVLPIAFGPVPFDVPYTCKRIERPSLPAVIQMTWDPTTLTAHAEHATWTLRTEGSYTLVPDPVTNAWISAAGNTTFILSLKRDNDPTGTMFEGFRMEHQFKIERIPGSFNEGQVLTSMWSAPRE